MPDSMQRSAGANGASGASDLSEEAQALPQFEEPLPIQVSLEPLLGNPSQAEGPRKGWRKLTWAVIGLTLAGSIGLGNWLRTAITDPAPQSQTVYVTRYGNRYHRANCGYLTRTQRPIGISAAREAGYTPCKVCRPRKK